MPVNPCPACGRTVCYGSGLSAPQYCSQHQDQQPKPQREHLRAGDYIVTGWLIRPSGQGLAGLDDEAVLQLADGKQLTCGAKVLVAQLQELQAAVSEIQEANKLATVTLSVTTKTSKTTGREYLALSRVRAGTTVYRPQSTPDRAHTLLVVAKRDTKTLRESVLAMTAHLGPAPPNTHEAHPGKAHAFDGEGFCLLPGCTRVNWKSC